MENNDIIKINTNNLKIIALVLYSIFTRLWHICHIYIYSSDFPVALSPSGIVLYSGILFRGGILS